jgi:hypothetical protein
MSGAVNSEIGPILAHSIIRLINNRGKRSIFEILLYNIGYMLHEEKHKI